MSKASAADRLRARLGIPERSPATAGTEASSGTEGSSKAKPMSMNDLIRSRPRRHVDLFGQPSSEESPDQASAGTEANAGTEEPKQTPAQTMNALIRAQARRYVISDPDEPPAEASSDDSTPD